MTKVLYLAGYGRSGSTILNIILGNHPEIAGVGAVANLVDDWDDPLSVCSCGLPYRSCEFWQDYAGISSPAKLRQVVQKVERLASSVDPLCRLISREERAVYAQHQRQLFEYVESHAHKPIIVDASKSARGRAGRFMALNAVANLDVYVLHLVRNGLDTMASLVVTGSNRELEGRNPTPRLLGMRSVVGWVGANSWASLLGRSLGEGRYLRLHYEDLLAHPAVALRRVGQFCGFNPEGLIHRIEQEDPFDVGHVVAGNRIRFQGPVKLRKDISRKPSSQLRTRHRLLFALMAGWLQRKYGYLPS